MKITTFEFIQRAENGGHPLDNESANKSGVGHGTPLLMLPKRQFVALLKRAKFAAGSVQIDYDLLNGVEEFLKENDQFLIEVDPGKLFGEEVRG